MSAPDLIAEYYRRDLDAAEDESLAALLESSPEASARFASLAADEYRGFGLPEPKGSGGGQRLPLGYWAGGIAVLLAAGLLWLAWPRHPKPLSIQEDPGAYQLPQPSEPEPEAEAEEPRATAPERRERRAPRLWVSAQTPQGPFDVRVDGSGVSKALGVYDGEGRSIARLREVGQDRYRWDGRDQQGRLAKPGAYQLRLRSGDEALKQWVEIEVR
jgi:hypothetical protein